MRTLLEDFAAVGTITHAALIARNAPAALRTNVRAALVATSLTLTSIDYARRRYLDDDDVEKNEQPARDAYVRAYKSVKSYLHKLRERMIIDGRPEPGAGVFASSVVLERLPASFFCAHLLYSLGHRYEGHAISRIILEQVAWAYEAHRLVDVDAIARIETTRSISGLKSMLPDAGRLYGFLSAKTHIDYDSHLEFLQVKEGVNIIQHAQHEYGEYADILLRLADLFGVVWELSQHQYLSFTETLEGASSDSPTVKQDRPFLEKMSECLAAVEKASISTRTESDDA